MKKLLKRLNELKSQIKALAIKDELTEDEQTELESLMAQAEQIQTRIDALQLAESDDDADADADADADPDADEDQKSLVAEVVSETLKALNADDGEKDNTKKRFKVPPGQMKNAHLGDPDPTEDFYRWIATGNGKIKKHLNREAELPHLEYNKVTNQFEYKMIKAPLQEGTDSEGGYLVPAGELGRIIAKRDEASLISRLGASIFTTDRDVFNIPTEGTAMTAFTIVAEEGAVSAAQNEPDFGQLAATIYKFMKVILMSSEIEEDYNSGLAAFLTSAIGRAWGITENYYVQVGTGSGQPQGVFVGGTAGLTLDSATAIGATEPSELIGKLKMAYRDGAVLVMNRTTIANLRGLESTTGGFLFGGVPTFAITAGGEDLGFGYPVIGTEDAAEIGASAKSMLFGNFALYGWVRNRSLRIERMAELYKGNDQIGLHCKFRAGGGVLQAEAFQYATHPTG
jgi:HK97 family phage major capsid protein